MEAVIAILVLIGVLSASGVLPEKSPPTANHKTQTAPLDNPRPFEVRPACDQHEPVYRDLTAPSRQRTSRDAGGKTESCCDE